MPAHGSRQHTFWRHSLQVAKVEAGRKAYIEVGNLEVVRDFTDVRDVVRGYRLLAQHGRSGEVYNLGSGRGTKLANALEQLKILAIRPVDVQLRRPGFAPSISPFWLQTRVSSARPPAGICTTPSNRPSLTCLRTAVRNSPCRS